MPKPTAEDVVREIYQHLYLKFDMERNGWVYDPDKQWDSETTSNIAVGIGRYFDAPVNVTPCDPDEIPPAAPDRVTYRVTIVYRVGDSRQSLTEDVTAGDEEEAMNLALQQAGARVRWDEVLRCDAERIDRVTVPTAPTAQEKR